MKRRTKAESAHLDRIANMACVCCSLMGVRQESKTDCHHIREDREARNDFLTLPLCAESCHKGPLGVHGDKTFLRILNMSEWALLAAVMEQLEMTA